MADKDYSAVFLYIGMASGALSHEDALEALITSLARGSIRREYIEYLRDKLNWALEYSK